MRIEGGRCTVVVGGTELAVSRRHTRALRDLLVRRNRPGSAAAVTDSPSGSAITSAAYDVRSPPSQPPTAAHEIDAQSQVGEVYLRSLLRAQLRLAVTVVVLLARARGRAAAAVLALAGLDRPSRSLGMPLAWVLLGFLVYPTLLAIGWWYVRAAERNERAFTDVVERP